HVLAQLLEAPRAIRAGIDADVLGQPRGVGGVLTLELAVDVAVEVPGAVEALVPAAAGVVAQPDLLALDAEHPLLDGLLEDLAAAAPVVVPPDEPHVTAADQAAVVGRLGPAAHAEVAEDPQQIVFVHAAVDGVEQFLVVAADGLFADPPAA